MTVRMSVVIVDDVIVQSSITTVSVDEGVFRFIIFLPFTVLLPSSCSLSS